MSEDNKNKEKPVPEQPRTIPNETAGINVEGHVLIRDKETGETLLNQRNAIHYGNMANLIANALNNGSGAYIQYMAFGNGGTSVDTTGKVLYKTPRVSEAFESGANLYATNVLGANALQVSMEDNPNIPEDELESFNERRKQIILFLENAGG